MPAFENSVRIPALAVIRHHIDSRIESDQVNTVTAVDGVRARVLVSLDHIIAGASVPESMPATAVVSLFRHSPQRVRRHERRCCFTG